MGGAHPRPRLLDLFCKAGGAARGYQMAGFHVTGIDIEPQPRYAGDEFHLADVFHLQQDRVAGCWHVVEPGCFAGPCLGRFDAIHASPPCQAYSVLRRANPDAEYPDLVAPTRDLLRAAGVPWVMENVPGAPLAVIVVLCGSMFGLGSGARRLRRHRLFESNVAMLQPSCRHDGEAIGVYGGAASARYTFANGIANGIAGRRGGYQGSAAECREAMGIDWMRRGELTQAIPPAYTEFIGHQLLAAVHANDMQET